MSEVHGGAARAAAGGHDRLQRRGQLRRLAAPLLAVHALPLAARADERRDGLRRPGRDRGEDRRAGAHSRLLRGRRRLPDERSGARDGGAGARRRALPRRRQRHVRNHPHAPGARVPWPRDRNQPDESGLRRLRGAPSAFTASASSGRRSSHRRSSGRSPRAARRCCICSSTRRRSLLTQLLRPSGRARPPASEPRPYETAPCDCTRRARPRRLRLGRRRQRGRAGNPAARGHRRLHRHRGAADDARPTRPRRAKAPARCPACA